MTAEAIIEAHANRLLDKWLTTIDCRCDEACDCALCPDCADEVEFDYEDSDEARWEDQDRDY